MRSSTVFARAQRSANLLAYLVEQTLQGRDGPLKEYAIGTEALGRPAAFDPKTDSLVRVEAHRLRARLGEYYAGEGASDPVVIDLPKGAYTPTFQVRVVEPPTEVPPDPIEELVAPRWRWTRRTMAATVAVGALILAAAFAVYASRVGTGVPSVATAAVLPFDVISDDARDRSLADGFSDELTAALASLPPLRVIARASLSKIENPKGDWRELAGSVHADAVVRGSLRRVGRRLRVTVQLIAVPGARQLWADSYQGEETDLAWIESDVVRRIGSALRIPTAGASGRSHRPAAAAYELYLRGRSLRATASAEGLVQASALFEAAATADPQFAGAFAGAAEVHATLAFHGLEPPVEGMAKARAAAARALALDPETADAYVADGLIRLAHDRDWPAAERSLRRAIALSPSAVRTRIWYALALSTRRRPDEALAQLAVARQLDPLSVGVGNDIAMTLYYARRYDEAMAEARRTLRANATQTVAHVLLGECLVEKARPREAVDEFRQAVDPSARVSLVVGRLGRALALSHRPDDARALLVQLDGSPVPSGTPETERAFIYAALGERDKAFACLNRALDAYEGETLFLDVAPAFDSLRDDPRFDALLRRAGLR